VVFEIAGVVATVLICHDLRYPEFIRLAVVAVRGYGLASASALCQRHVSTS
jgi:predicted amidohydrolase